jgi:hypothetical protein
MQASPISALFDAPIWRVDALARRLPARSRKELSLHNRETPYSMNT